MDKGSKEKGGVLALSGILSASGMAICLNPSATVEQVLMGVCLAGVGCMLALFREKLKEILAEHDLGEDDIIVALDVIRNNSELVKEVLIQKGIDRLVVIETMSELKKLEEE